MSYSQKQVNQEIPDNALCDFWDLGNNKIELRWREVNPQKHLFVLQNSHSYAKRKKSGKRTDNLNHLYSTYSSLRRLIKRNFSDNNPSECFLTLTYSTKMQNHKQLHSDFSKFYRRLQYHYPANKLEYVAVSELQKRNSWHLHVLLKDISGNVLPFTKSDIRKIWKKGKVDCQSITDVYHLACYLSPKLQDKNDKKNKLLCYYPAGIRIYRTSRGIIHPTLQKAAYKTILAEYQLKNSHHTYAIDPTTGEVVNTYIFQCLQKM